MKKIDCFIENNNQLSTEDKVLVYGEGQIMNEVVSNLELAEINYKIITENMILEEKKKYDFMLVVSDNDLDNLMLCSLGRRILDMKNIIAVCNDKNNRRLFNEYGAISFDRKYVCSDKFILTLKEKVNNE